MICRTDPIGLRAGIAALALAVSGCGAAGGDAAPLDDTEHAGSPETLAQVEAGRALYRGGEHFAALDQVETALAADPGDPQALLFRGQIARDASGPALAIPWFERALAADSDDIAIRTEFAATLSDAGRARKALAVLREGDKGALGDPRGLFVQALIAARGEDWALARKLLDRSIAGGWRRPASTLLSATIDLEAGLYDSAAQQLSGLMRSHGDSERVSDLLALALCRSGNHRELTTRFFDRAAGARGSPYLRTLVARGFEALGDRRRAAYFLDMAARPAPGLASIADETAPGIEPSARDGPGMRAGIRAAIAAGNDGAALDRAQAFVAAHPASADALALLGDAQLAADDAAAARRTYARAAQIRQGWPMILRRVAAESDPAARSRLLADYLVANPREAAAAALMADALIEQGDFASAAILLDHAIAHGARRTPRVLALRSRVAWELGNIEAARGWAIEAHDLQPLNAMATAALIAALGSQESDAKLELQAKLSSLGGQ